MHKANKPNVPISFTKAREGLTTNKRDVNSSTDHLNVDDGKKLMLLRISLYDDADKPFTVKVTRGTTLNQLKHVITNVGFV